MAWTAGGDETLWDGLTLDEANIYEQIEIRDNETLYPYGYNLSYGRANNLKDLFAKGLNPYRKNSTMLGKI